MYLLIPIVVLATIAAGIFIQISSEKEDFENLGNDESTYAFYINTDSIQKSTDEIYNILLETAKNHQVNLIKSDMSSQNNQFVIQKSLLFTTPTDLLRVTAASGKLITIDSLNHNEIYTTDNISKNSENVQIKEQLYSLLGANHLTIQTLQRTVDENGSLSGKYLLKTEQNPDAFLAELSQKLGVSQEQIEKSFFTFNTINGNFAIFASAGFALIICFIFGIMIVFYVTKNFSVIGNCKLLGFSDTKIWALFFLPIVGVQVISIVAALVILKTFTNIHWSILLKVSAYALLSVALVLLVLGIAFIMIRHYTVSDLLKKKSPVKAVIFLSSAIRFIALIVVTSILLSGLNYCMAFIDEYAIFKQWDQYGNQYAVINTLSTDEDIADMAQGNTSKLEQRYARFFEKVNKTGALYTITTELLSDPYLNLPDFDSSKLTEKIDTTLMKVNTNYLKDIPVLLENGNNALTVIDENETDVIYLLPDTLKPRESEFRHMFEYDRQDEIRSIQKYALEKDSSLSPNIKILYYQSGQNFFSFNMAVARENNYMLQDPIFSVLTTGNMNYFDKINCYAHGGTPDCTLKLPTNGLSDNEIYQRYQALIKEVELENNITKITSLKSTFEGEIAALKSYALPNFLIALAFILLSLWVNFVIARIKIESNKRELCIKTLLGFSFFDKYKNMYLTSIVTWLLQSVIGYLQYDSSHVESNYLTPIVIIAAMLFLLAIDILFLTLSIKNNESKSINTAIKGA